MDSNYEFYAKVKLKNRITIKKEIRDISGIQVGDMLKVTVVKLAPVKR